MFTGIIECIGTITSIRDELGAREFTISSEISNELKVDQSLAHNGVCLTVTSCSNGRHTVCAIEETIAKTTLGVWQTGDILNLERCMMMNGRLDGHIVQGHVDTTALCLAHKAEATQHVYTFQTPEKFAPLLIEKGSVCVNGISLTCFNITSNSFQVAIIPYTFEHTTIHTIEAGKLVNIEFDVIGKYVQRMQQLLP